MINSNKTCLWVRFSLHPPVYLIWPNREGYTTALTGGMSGSPRASLLSSGSGMGSPVLALWLLYERNVHPSLVPKDFTRSSEPSVLTIFQASWTSQAQEFVKVLSSVPRCCLQQEPFVKSGYTLRRNLVSFCKAPNS